MAYFEDLTPYTYIAYRPGCPKALNVGWLSANHEYPKGDVPSTLLEKLKWLAVTQITNATRGLHVCEMCGLGNFESQISTVWNGRVRVLGSAEIWVPSNADFSYAAPNLIIHYIEAHGYRPPDVFLESLLKLEN